MLGKKAIEFIRQEHPEVNAFYEKGILYCEINKRRFTFTLKNHSRETLDRHIKDSKQFKKEK